MGNLLELRWHVDSNGYAVDGEGPVLADRQAVLVAMVTRLTDLLLKDEGAYTHLVPRRGHSKPYSCLADDYNILLDLLNMADTPEGVQRFVNQWGLLGPTSDEQQRRTVCFIATRKGLARVLEDGLPRAASDLVLASLQLVRGRNGKLALRANTLADFLWAQAFQLRQGAVFQCSVCKKFALAPAIGRPKEICSDACRSKAYRQRRTAPVADVAEQVWNRPRARVRARP
jgi:hypothetical protein